MQKLKLVLAKGIKRIFNPPALRECNIHKTSRICAGSELTRVDVGRYTYVGNKCFMVNVQIGSFCSIADKCSIGGAAHPMERVSMSPVFHKGKNILKTNFAELPAIKTPNTILENDVWLGMGCYIKSGVTIHNGAVVGMGSVVTKDIPAYEIWAGNPAKKIGERFDKDTCDQLQKIAWWDWTDKKIQDKAALFDDVRSFVGDQADEREQRTQ